MRCLWVAQGLMTIHHGLEDIVLTANGPFHRTTHICQGKTVPNQPLFLSCCPQLATLCTTVSSLITPDSRGILL